MSVWGGRVPAQRREGLGSDVLAELDAGTARLAAPAPSAPGRQAQGGRGQAFALVPRPRSEPLVRNGLLTDDLMGSARS